MSDVAVIGAGYVGLTTAACFAHLGHDVVCADIDEDRIAQLDRGEVPILESGLEQLISEGVSAGRLRFVVGAAEAARACEFAYLSVPTPQGPDGRADLSYIEAAAREIGPVLPADAVVINKSTVPVGSTRVVEQALGRSDVYVVSNPEFLREGSAVADFLHPDRVVIGSEDQGAAIRVASLYVGVPAPLMVTDPASAETIKYASNAFLATKLSFVNAVAAVCEAVGADVNDVVLGMGYDKRIGHDFLKPGPGYGGSCFAGEETLLVRTGGLVRLLRFADLAEELRTTPLEGYEALAWVPGDPSPEFFPIAAFTERTPEVPVVEVLTKMGRRVRCTADHPFVIGDGTAGGPTSVRLAGELTPNDWLPIAQHAPLPLDWERTEADFSQSLQAGEVERSKRLPDVVWTRTDAEKRSVLRGLWDGDGSWSLVAGGPSVVLEYGTVSRQLADGMLRLLGDLGVVARLKVGRTATSTVDTYWLVISGADQVESACWLLPDDEAAVVRTSIAGQRKRIRPTGYRPDGKNAAWVRVAGVTPVEGVDTVYSVEVPGPHTVVTTGGLVAHNCFPKDTQALVRIAEDAGYDFRLLQGVIDVNEEQFDRVVRKVQAMAGGDLDGVSVGAWGLTFKARTDDLRESPALEVLRRLLDKGASVRAYDPAVDGSLDSHPGIDVVDDPYAACEDAQVLVVLTEWDEFRWLDLDKVAGSMAEKRVVDARNLLDRAALQRRGFAFEGIGR